MVDILAFERVTTDCVTLLARGDAFGEANRLAHRIRQRHNLDHYFSLKDPTAPILSGGTATRTASRHKRSRS